MKLLFRSVFKRVRNTLMLMPFNATKPQRSWKVMNLLRTGFPPEYYMTSGFGIMMVTLLVTFKICVCNECIEHLMSQSQSQSHTYLVVLHINIPCHVLILRILYCRIGNNNIPLINYIAQIHLEIPLGAISIPYCLNFYLMLQAL